MIIAMPAKLYALTTGVEGLFIQNDRFNTTSVSFNFYLPLSPDTIAENALLPFMLTSCGAQYPDFSKLNFRLNQLYGAQLDASAEKLGDYQLLKMSISVIHDRYTLGGESLLKQAIGMLLSLIFEPNAQGDAFSETDLAREKRKAIEHIKGEISEKRIYAKNRLIEEMYKGKAYGLPKCGTIENVQTITGKSLYRAWQEMLRKAYVRVQVIGATLPDGLFEEVTARFGGIARGDIPDLRRVEATESVDRPTLVTEHMDIKQGKLVMGFSSDLAGDDDDTLPLMVAVDIFGGGPYSRLFANVREKMSLCYYCSASAARFKGMVTVDSGVEAENAEKAQEAILAQLTAMQKGEFSEFEFSSSIKSIRDSLYSYNDSQVALDVWYALKAANRTLRSPEELAEMLNTVTREQVERAAQGIRLHTVYKLMPENKEDPS